MLEYLDIAIGFATVMLLLSLIVTATVQAVSTLLDLRGNNLVWALTKLFEQMPVPDIDKKGKTSDGQAKRQPVSTELALAVAKHSSIAASKAFSWWKAKAIRPDELENIVHKLAASPPQDMSEEAKAALKQLVEERVPGTGDALEQAKTVAAELEKLFPARAQAMRDAVEQVMGKTRRIGAEIETWFDTVMDRSADRFARNSRVWAVGIGAVLVIGLQVNAVSIFEQISRNSGVRSQLVAMAQPTLQQAKEVEDYANIAGKTLAEMKQEDAYKAQLQNAPDSIHRCPDGETWIKTNVTTPDAALMEFQQRCAKRSANALGSFPEQILTLRASVDQTQLAIFGRPKDSTWYGHVLGCLCTVILLSLGAPFWFNALRQLSSLRPPISQKITQEQQASTQGEKPGPAAGAGK